MSKLTLPAVTLDEFRRRRAAGERVSDLAKSINVGWQKLEKALRHGGPPPTVQAAAIQAVAVQAVVDTLHDPPPLPKLVPILTLTPVGRAGPLTERYRPRSLEALLGQPTARTILERFAQHPRPMAFLFEGETGTGKTSAAVALAAALGCAVAQEEFGGLWSIASGEQTADAVRQAFDRLWVTPMCGSGWRVLVVNEADRINRAAETIWLDRLEGLPPRSVIVFTTNFSGEMSQRFRDRCVRVPFACDAAALESDARRLIAAIWRAERGTEPTAPTIAAVLSSSVESGKLSFRRLVQAVEARVLGGA